jgi:hypothetical protein
MKLQKPAGEPDAVIEALFEAGYTSKDISAVVKRRRDRERSERRAIFRQSGRPSLSPKVSLIIWSAVWVQAILTAVAQQRESRAVNFEDAITAVASRGVWFGKATRKPHAKVWRLKPGDVRMSRSRRSRSYVESHFYEIERHRRPRNEDAPLYARLDDPTAVRRRLLGDPELEYTDGDVDRYLVDARERHQKWLEGAGERFDEFISGITERSPWCTNLGAANYGPSLFLQAVFKLQSAAPGGIRFHFTEGGVIAPQIVYFLIFGDWRLRDEERAAIEDELLPIRHWGLGEHRVGYKTPWVKPAPELPIALWSHK